MKLSGSETRNLKRIKANNKETRAYIKMFGIRPLGFTSSDSNDIQYLIKLIERRKEK